MSSRANAFLVWRSGSGVDWDCTARDISQETGLSVAHVRLICGRKGWTLRTGVMTNGVHRMSVDRLINGDYNGYQGKGD